jgi:hypothetical protein
MRGKCGLTCQSGQSLWPTQRCIGVMWGGSLWREIVILSPYLEVSAELEGKYVYAVSDTVSLSIEGAAKCGGGQ